MIQRIAELVGLTVEQVSALSGIKLPFAPTTFSGPRGARTATRLELRAESVMKAQSVSAYAREFARLVSAHLKNPSVTVISGGDVNAMGVMNPVVLTPIGVASVLVWASEHGCPSEKLDAVYASLNVRGGYVGFQPNITPAW